MSSEADYEKGSVGKNETHLVTEEHAPDAAIVGRFGAFGDKVLGPLFKAGVEARGVERVPENERSEANMWNNLLMWFVSVVDFISTGRVSS
jgi:hypothetical protein